MDLEIDFGDGEVYEAKVQRDLENEPEYLEHLAHIPIKTGRTVYKSVTIWEISDSSSNQPYIIEFFKWRKDPEAKVGLVEDEKNKFRCEKDEISALLSGLANIEEFGDLDSDDYAIIKKESPPGESLGRIFDILEDLEDSEEVAVEIINQLSEIFEQKEDEGIEDNILDSDALEAESFLAHSRLKSKLDEFSQLIDEEEREQEYQDFLEQNSWLFGSNYVGKVNFRSITYAEEVDFCLKSVDGYFDVIEIKRPQHKVLKKDESHDNFYPSDRLSKAIRQTQNYIHQIEAEQSNILRRTDLEMLKPRGIIVIGNEIDEDKREDLRIINSHLNRIEVLTYSDLRSVGERLIENYNDKQELNEINIGDS